MYDVCIITYKSPPPTYPLIISHLCHCCFTCCSLPLKRWVSSLPSSSWGTREERESRVRVPVMVRSLSRAEGENVGGRGRAEGEKLRQTMKASVSSCQVGAGEKKGKSVKEVRRTGTTLTATSRFSNPHSTPPSLWIIPLFTHIPLLLPLSFLSRRFRLLLKLPILPKLVLLLVVIFGKWTGEETPQLRSQKLCMGVKRREKDFENQSRTGCHEC